MGLGVAWPGPAAVWADPPVLRPLTPLEAGPLGRADLVVVGRLEAVHDTRPKVVGRVRVERVLKGEAPGPTVTVIVAGPRPTLDPDNPSAPYWTEQSGGRWVLFLAGGGRSGRADGYAFVLDALFQADGALGAEKLANLEAEARLLGESDPEARARATREHFLGALEQGGAWTRVHAARTLNHLQEVRPDLLEEPEARARLERVLRRSLLPEQRRWLGSLLALRGAPAPAQAPPAPDPGAASRERLAGRIAQAPGPAERTAVFQSILGHGAAGADLLLDLLATETPAIRAEGLGLLAEAGHRSALARIRLLYAHESSPAVLVQIVSAVGLLGTAEDVPWLVERIASARVRRVALVALARIGTPSAREALEAARDRARAALERVGAQEGEGPAEGAARVDAREADRDTVELVDYLLGPAFARAEAAAGRAPGPR